MKRFVVKVKVDRGSAYIHHKRDVVTTLAKEAILEHFTKLYSKHVESGHTVEVTFLQELECGELFEIL